MYIYVRLLTQNKKKFNGLCAFLPSLLDHKIHNSRLGVCAERKFRNSFLKSIFCTLHAFCMSHMQHSSTSSLRPLSTLLKLLKQFKGPHSKKSHWSHRRFPQPKLGTNLLHSKPHIFCIYIFYTYAITLLCLHMYKQIIQTRL